MEEEGCAQGRAQCKGLCKGSVTFSEQSTRAEWKGVLCSADCLQASTHPMAGIGAELQSLEPRQNHFSQDEKPLMPLIGFKGAIMNQTTLTLERRVHW